MTPEEILAEIGIEADDLDGFKSKFKEKYVSSQVYNDELKKAKDAHGESWGKSKTKAKQTFKALGVEFEDGELKDKELPDILELGYTKLDAKIKDMTDKINGANPDLEKIEGKYKADLEAKAKKIEELTNFWETSKAEKEEVEKNLTGKLNDFKVGYSLKEAYGKVAFKDGMTELERKGFNAHIDEKYIFKLEEDELAPFDRKTGERVKDTKGYVPVTDVLNMEAKEVGLAKQNGTPANPVKKTVETPSNNGEGRKLHPEAAR